MPIYTAFFPFFLIIPYISLVIVEYVIMVMSHDGVDGPNLFVLGTTLLR